VQLRERVERWDRLCKREKRGPYNSDPRRAHDTSCDFVSLKDERWDPNADEFSRYAHSIQLPPPFNLPQATYRQGMTSEKYFEELCAKEAGQWIFKTATGVEGLLQVRPEIKIRAGLNQLVPQAQEPVFTGVADDLTWLDVGSSGENFPYAFFEYQTLNERGSKIVQRYYRSAKDLTRVEGNREFQWRSSSSRFRVPYVLDTESRAVYGYVGRGLTRPEFVEHGIVASELLVIDNQTHTVLALARNFVSVRPMSGPMSTDTQMLLCANAPEAVRSPMKFVAAVLRPVGSR
jgi:hypothetical protein